MIRNIHRCRGPWCDVCRKYIVRPITQAERKCGEGCCLESSLRGTGIVHARIRFGQRRDIALCERQVQILAKGINSDLAFFMRMHDTGRVMGGENSTCYSLQHVVGHKLLRVDLVEALVDRAAVL